MLTTRKWWPTPVAGVCAPCGTSAAVSYVSFLSFSSPFGFGHGLCPPGTCRISLWWIATRATTTACGVRPGTLTTRPGVVQRWGVAAQRMTKSRCLGDMWMGKPWEITIFNGKLWDVLPISSNLIRCIWCSSLFMRDYCPDSRPMITKGYSIFLKLDLTLDRS